MQFIPAAAGRDDLRNGLRDRINRAVIRAPARQIRIKAVAHHRYCLRLAVMNRYLRNHRLGLRALVFSAVRHVDRRSSDGGVEHLDKSLLRAGVEIGELCLECVREIGIILLQDFIHLRTGDFLEIIVILLR